MDFLSNLALGFDVATTSYNLLFCFIGVLVGTLVGVLPGVGPIATLSVILPFTTLVGSPAASIIMMAGIFYGTQYGGSITSILLKVPGESSSIVTTLDGHALARQGKAGTALSIAAIGSFIAGTVATILIAWLGEPFAQFALKFGPSEYATTILFGFIASAFLTSTDNPLKSLAMILLGVLLSTIGIDLNSGIERFTFNNLNLYDGVPFAILAIGFFGLSEIFYDILTSKKDKPVVAEKVNRLYPTSEELKASTPAIARGTILGSILGILPGIGVTLTSFITYAFEKKLSKTPEKFGKGAIEGVAAPESANNAASQTAFIPLLSLGLPGTAAMALMFGTLMVNGIVPGPQLMTQHPGLFWGLVVSMWIGNFMLLILNLPLVGLWVQILKIPKNILYFIVIVFALAGAYFIENNMFFVLLLIPIVLLALLLKSLGFEMVLLGLGFAMGKLFEENIIRALTISQGDWSIFLNSGISLTMLVCSCILILINKGVLKKWKI